MERPSWDDYFMAIAHVVATRSIDQSTKCGCVIVGSDHRVISLGYNGPPRGVDDDKVPQTRPEKYVWFEHAERNAIFNARVPMDEAIAYVTSLPCVDCFRALIQCGIRTVWYCPTPTNMENNEMMKNVCALAEATGRHLFCASTNFTKVTGAMNSYLATKGIQQ